MKCLDCNKICTGETRKKFKSRLVQQKKDANKDDDMKNTGHVIDLEHMEVMSRLFI